MTSISSTTDVGTLAYTLYNLRQTQRTVDTLTAQTSSGYISSDYAGLGNGAASAIDLTGELALNKTLQANTQAAGNIQQVTQTALGQIQTLVSGLSSQLVGAATSDAQGLNTLASNANAVLGQVAGLLDTKVGNVYIFAGQDSSNPPVPNPSTVTASAFYTAIQTAVAGLTSSSATAVQAQLLTAAAPGATSPFSTTLEASNQPATVDLGNGESVQVGVLADTNAAAVSTGTGTTSTGSYMRDIFMGLATLGSLNGSDPANAQVQAMLTNIHTTLSGADDALNVDIGALGVQQNTVTNAQTEFSGVATALTTQLGNVQNADPATVATELSTAQAQLQASYSIISALRNLTLTKYLT